MVAALLGAAWRWFDREPEDYGWKAEELATNPVLARFDGFYTPVSAILSLLGVMALAASALAAFVPALPIR